MTIAAGEPDAGTYLPVWNGHGVAVNLSRLNTDGSLTLANRYRYGTWGRPETATHNGIAEIRLALRGDKFSAGRYGTWQAKMRHDDP